jgi:hypothetical protein
MASRVERVYIMVSNKEALKKPHATDESQTLTKADKIIKITTVNSYRHSVLNEYQATSKAEQ